MYKFLSTVGSKSPKGFAGVAKTKYFSKEMPCPGAKTP
jgi:hypothetical protein